GLPIRPCLTADHVPFAGVCVCDPDHTRSGAASRQTRSDTNGRAAINCGSIGQSSNVRNSHPLCDPQHSLLVWLTGKGTPIPLREDFRMLAFKITTLAIGTGAVGAGLLAEFLSSDFGAEV